MLLSDTNVCHDCLTKIPQHYSEPLCMQCWEVQDRINRLNSRIELPDSDPEEEDDESVNEESDDDRLP